MTQIPRTRDHKSKEEVFWAVFEAVIRLDVQKGHLSWKISDIARASKISRPLIYYYFGQSKESIMKTAIHFLGEEYFGLSVERRQLWQEGNFLESVLRTRNLSQKYPHIHFFYIYRRNMENFVGELLRNLESRYRKKIKDHFNDLDSDSVDALAAVLFGLVVMPEISNQGIINALGVVSSITKPANKN